MNFHLFSSSDFVKMKPDEAFIKRINYYWKHEQHREIHQFNQLYHLKMVMGSIETRLCVYEKNQL